MVFSRFRYQAQVTLDVNGYGAVRVGPAGRDWIVESLSVRTNTRVLEAQFKVYANNIGELFTVDGTRSGSSGDTSDTVHYVHDGEGLWFEWSGGDASATAVAVYSGAEYLPGTGGF